MRGVLILAFALGAAAPALAQQAAPPQAATEAQPSPAEEVLLQRLTLEYRGGLLCAISQTKTARDLAAAQARIRELEADLAAARPGEPKAAGPAPAPPN